MKFERIRSLRQDSDIKQETMQEYLNIKQATYSKYELGKINVPVEMLIRIAEYHNVSLDYLIGVTDEKRPY